MGQPVPARNELQKAVEDHAAGRVGTRHRRELLTRDLATACLAVMGCKDVYPMTAREPSWTAPAAW